MYQTGHTIKDTLNQIQRNDLVLPAIQREFVWRPDQICRLFDSLMQGYPFGTFLYWQVNPENSDKFKFYDFVLNYHQKNNRHNPTLPMMSDRKLTAVLDGQQRLTALNIGLRGSMALKQPKLWWSNPNAFPICKLYLDLLWQPDEDDEEGLRYRFNFRTDEQIAVANEKECWFLVRDILSMSSGPAMVRWLNKRLPQEQVDLAYEILHELHKVVHTDHLIAFYEEREQELEKVLQIFIRMNSGGTILSYSDMLLSVAVAQWKQHDAREEIHSLVDNLNDIGGSFTFPKDLVLKAGLMLIDIGSIAFKVDNFNRENMADFERKWDDIKQALTLTVQLISNFGFNGQNLTATNAILPIAYYLYKKNPGQAYLTSSKFNEDRKTIREWLIRSLLKGIWGGASDTLLTALRQVIRTNGSNSGFPVTQVQEELTRQGRSLVFEDEEIEDLADMQYGNRLAFALLSLLFPFVKVYTEQFHIDHIFPVARFTRHNLRSNGVSGDKIDDFIQRRNGLANLQLLHGVKNIEKSAKMPDEWLKEAHPDFKSRQQYRANHLLGEIPKTMSEFDTFYNARRERLKAEIKQLLGR